MLRVATGPETIRLGDLEVRRLGFGTTRLTGRGVWGEPDDPATARAVLRRGRGARAALVTRRSN